MEKREIHALDYAACSLMTRLNIVFAGRLPGWGLPDQGLNLELVGVVKNLGVWIEAMVRIKPVGWPESSFIFGRFTRYDDERRWTIAECSIFADHLQGFRRVLLKWESDVYPFFSMREKNTPEASLFEEIVSRSVAVA